MATFVIVRHAQASFGSRDYDALSTLGASQADATGRYLEARGIRFDRTLIGPRLRHAETARRIVAQPWDEAGSRNAALDECGAGLAIMQRILADRAGASRREQLDRYLDELDAWGRGGRDESGCETRAAFGARVTDWFEQACAGVATGERVLVVTSAGVVAFLVSEVLHAPPSAWGQLLRTMRNASITELLVSRGRRSLASFNSTAHLPPDSVTGI